MIVPTCSVLFCSLKSCSVPIFRKPLSGVSAQMKSTRRSTVSNNISFFGELHSRRNKKCVCARACKIAGECKYISLIPLSQKISSGIEDHRGLHLISHQNRYFQNSLASDDYKFKKKKIAIILSNCFMLNSFQDWFKTFLLFKTATLFSL